MAPQKNQMPDLSMTDLTIAIKLGSKYFFPFLELLQKQFEEVDFQAHLFSLVLHAKSKKKSDSENSKKKYFYKQGRALWNPFDEIFLTCRTNI